MGTGYAHDSLLDSESFGSVRVSEPWGLRRIEGLKVSNTGGLCLVHQDHEMRERGWDPLNCTCVGLVSLGFRPLWVVNGS